MMNGIEKPHVVAVPFPALGHSIPLLDFVKVLASHGLTVTCATTPANAPRLKHQMNQAISSGLDIRLLLLPTPLVEGLPEGLESFDLVPTESCGLIFELAEKLEAPFNHWLDGQLQKEGHQGTRPPVCIMHDALMGWNLEGPKKHNIPTVVFSTYGAFGVSVLRSAWLSASQKALEKEEDSLVLSMDLPSAITLHRHEIDDGLFVPFMMEIIGRLQSINQGWGMLINTFQEMEPQYLCHLKKLTGKLVWPIGPLLPPNFFGGAVKASARGKVADISEEELVEWMDCKSHGSVVYISFGSQTFLSEEQSHALACGVEASQQPFIWSIKVSPKMDPATSDTTTIDLARTYLPQGFQERTKSRGLVIWGWVPQLVILSHPSVGAFMSHCGWNSLLESITLGVPLITWPMYADQHFNSKLAVESLIGVQFCEHRFGIPDKERVIEAVQLVLNKDGGKAMKREAENLMKMARKSAARGGSSNENLQDFVSEIYKLEMARKGNACGSSAKAELQDDFVSEMNKLSISKTI